MYDERNHPQAKLGQAPRDAPMSRIDNQVERLKSLKRQLEIIEARVMRNARSLGFFVDSPAPANSTISPVISDVETALNELEQQINNVSCALNVYD